MTERDRRDAAGMTPAQVYARRFAGLGDSRRHLWESLCHHFFAKWIPPDSCVVDIAAGHCEFINSIEARRRIAVDINPATASLAAPEVDVYTTSALNLSRLGIDPIDVAFASNLFEHLDRTDIVETIRQVAQVLRPGGRFLILQPNIRFTQRDYWMYFDHITPIDDRAICEVLEIEGFVIERCIPRFLPFTTKGSYPISSWLVRLYIALPLVWRLFGAQAFVVARKPG